MQTHARPSATFGRASSQASSVAQPCLPWGRGGGPAQEAGDLLKGGAGEGRRHVPGPGAAPWTSLLTGCQAPGRSGAWTPPVGIVSQAVPPPGATRPRATLGGCVTWPKSLKSGPGSHHGQEPRGRSQVPAPRRTICPRQPRCPPPGLAGVEWLLRGARGPPSSPGGCGGKRPVTRLRAWQGGLSLWPPGVTSGHRHRPAAPTAPPAWHLDHGSPWALRADASPAQALLLQGPQVSPQGGPSSSSVPPPTTTPSSPALHPDQGGLVPPPLPLAPSLPEGRTAGGLGTWPLDLSPSSNPAPPS